MLLVATRMASTCAVLFDPFTERTWSQRHDVSPIQKRHALLYGASARSVDLFSGGIKTDCSELVTLPEHGKLVKAESESL